MRGSCQRERAAAEPLHRKRNIRQPVESCQGFAHDGDAADIEVLGGTSVIRMHAVAQNPGRTEFSDEIDAMRVGRSAIHAGRRVEILTAPVDDARMKLTVQRLEKRNFVRLSKRRSDARVTEVHLTPLGPRCVERERGTAGGIYRRAVRDFSPANVALLNRLTRRIFGNLS